MTPRPPVVDYLSRQRHLLVDMHVPDWDEGFLRNFDPLRAVDLYERSGADSVMMYCNSMLGLTYWPTRVGRMHPALNGRDIVGETVDLLHRKGFAACAYYSANFNDHAYGAEPSRRIDNVAAFGAYGKESRFGVVCPSSADFVGFARAEAEEIARDYEFDAFFVDMMFWTGICVCENCRARFRDEIGSELPKVVDWFSPAWPAFQKARERWLTSQYGAIADAVKRHRAIPVFNNSSTIPAGWRAGLSMELLKDNDLLGGDVHAGPDELLAFGLLTSRLSGGSWQYMHSASGYLSGAAKTISAAEQASHALVATALDGQFMTIDAVLSDGSLHAPTYDRLAEVFAAMKPYEPYLGGIPAADVAVYYSPSADVDFADNGTPVSELRPRRGFLQPLPHGQAVAGACGALQRAHLPVGVVTRADLGDLDAFRVVVLPNVLRMDDEEIAAFRDYVDRGGRLFASGYTSLVATAGTRYDDFALADVFGAHFKAVEPAVVSYVRPVCEPEQAAIAPAAMVPHGATRPPSPGAPELGLTSLIVDAGPRARVIATHTRPYGLGRGTRHDRAWSSILTSPPWEDTGRPTIVGNVFGEGRAVYSACDLEAGGRGGNVAAEQLFVSIIRDLLAGPAIVEAETNATVWVVPFDEPDERRIRINLLNYQPTGPHLPVPCVSLHVVAPAGATFAAVRRLPGGEPLGFEVCADNRALIELHDLELFDMISVEYR